jgi:hypothetical protein
LDEKKKVRFNVLKYNLNDLFENHERLPLKEFPPIGYQATMEWEDGRPKTKW